MHVIAHKEVADLGSVTIHCAAGIDPPVTYTIPSHVLYRIQQTGFNNGESHNRCLMCKNGLQKKTREYVSG
jgi:hypothetical protein